MKKEVKGRRKIPIDRCLERTPISHEFTAHLVSNAVVEEAGRDCSLEGVIVIEPKFAAANAPNHNQQDVDLRIYAKLYCECVLKNSKKLLHEEMISIYPPSASASISEASPAQQEIIKMFLEQRGETVATSAYCPFRIRISHTLPPTVSIFSRATLELVYGVSYVLSLFAAFNASDRPEPSRTTAFHIRRLALRELPYFVNAEAAARARRSANTSNSNSTGDQLSARRPPRRSGQYERIEDIALDRALAPSRPLRPFSVGSRAAETSSLATRPKSAPLSGADDVFSPARPAESPSQPSPTAPSEKPDDQRQPETAEVQTAQNPLAIASVPHEDLVRSNVRLECSLDRRVYWPTGTVCVSVLIDNDSDITWKSIKLQLVQRVIIAYFGSSPKRKRLECVIDEVRTSEAFPITHQAGWCKEYRLRPCVVLPRRVTGAIEEEGFLPASDTRSAGSLRKGSSLPRTAIDRGAPIRAKPERTADCSSGLSRLLVPGFGANRNSKMLPALNGLLTDATSYQQLALAASTRFEQLFCCDSPSRHAEWKSIEVDYFVAISLYPSTRTRQRMQVRLPFTLLTAPPPDGSYGDAPIGPHRDSNAAQPNGVPPAASHSSSLRKKKAQNEISGASLKHVQFDAAQNSEYTVEQLEEWQQYYATYGYGEYAQAYSDQYGGVPTQPGVTEGDGTALVPDTADQSAVSGADQPVLQPNADAAASFGAPASQVQPPPLLTTQISNSSDTQMQRGTSGRRTSNLSNGGDREKSEQRRWEPREHIVKQFSFQNPAAELNPEEDEIHV